MEEFSSIISIVHEEESHLPLHLPIYSQPIYFATIIVMMLPQFSNPLINSSNFPIRLLLLRKTCFHPFTCTISIWSIDTQLHTVLCERACVSVSLCPRVPFHLCLGTVHCTCLPIFSASFPCILKRKKKRATSLDLIKILTLFYNRAHPQHSWSMKESSDPQT